MLYKFILWNACQSIWWNTFVFLKMIFKMIINVQKMIINVQWTDGSFPEPLFLFWQVESLWGIDVHVKKKVSVGFLFFHKYQLYQLYQHFSKHFTLWTGEDYHKIPMENFENADSNYRGLWIQLENFVNPNGEKPEYPPMYCLVR